MNALFISEGMIRSQIRGKGLWSQEASLRKVQQVEMRHCKCLFAFPICHHSFTTKKLFLVSYFLSWENLKVLLYRHLRFDVDWKWGETCRRRMKVLGIAQLIFLYVDFGVV